MDPLDLRLLFIPFSEPLLHKLHHINPENVRTRLSRKYCRTIAQLGRIRTHFMRELRAYA
jgi:hypothetical protein